MTRQDKKMMLLAWKQIRKILKMNRFPEERFNTRLKGETASYNWRRMHGLKPHRRVNE